MNRKVNVALPDRVLSRSRPEMKSLSFVLSVVEIAVGRDDGARSV